MSTWSALLMDICGDTLKDLARTTVRQHLLKPPGRPRLEADTGESPAPQETHCPFCSVAKSLAIAHRYLIRGKDRPHMATIYQELSRHAVADALRVADEIGAGPGPTIIKLLALLNKLDLYLSKPMQPAEMGETAELAWVTSDLALDMAEWYNTDRAKLQSPRMGEVIDGEARVVA